MKKSQQLIALAKKLSNKYAMVDASTIANRILSSIHQAVFNASTVPSSGIMDFPKMLNQDQADLSINVTRDGGSISVSLPAVTPANLASKYAYLSGQIEHYLRKNPDLFPFKFAGDDVSYNNLTITLTYNHQ